MANGYKFQVGTRPGVEGKNIAFAVDFKTPESAANSAREMVKDKADYSVVKDKVGDERTVAILDFVKKEVCDNLHGFVVDKIFSRYESVPSGLEELEHKNSVFEAAASLVPSIGAILSAYKKVFGEISAAEPIYANFPQLKPEHIAQIEKIQREISDINRSQARDESDRIEKKKDIITEMSKTDRDKWYKSYEDKKAKAINNYRPYQIVMLNYTHLPQEFRNDEAEMLYELSENEEFKKKTVKERTEAERSVRRTVLVKFKSEELDKYFANVDFYSLPEKQSS